MLKLLNKVMGPISTPLNCGASKIIIMNYSTSKTLPNEVLMAEELAKELANLQYDLITGDWFEYSDITGSWKRLSRFQIDQKIFSLLKNKEGVTGLLTSEYKNKVRAALEMLNGEDFEDKRPELEGSQMVPFKNGVLDLNTKLLMSHNKKFYFTYSLNIKYDPQAKLSTKMVDFLLSISNDNIYTLKTFRSYIQCVLLRDNQHQVALYLYGPGGTGKSTFEKLLISLVGRDNAATLSLNDLNKQFSIVKILDKSLVLFSDVQGYTGDPSKLRLLISGDMLSAERKYKDSFDLQPNCLVVLSSNHVWNPDDSSTGLQRRIIYISVSNVPSVPDRNLFNYDLKTNQCTGTLAESLPGLVNWALSNPRENLYLLNNAVETNKLISPTALSETNPLVAWINTHIKFEFGNTVFIGKKTSDLSTHLFPNYLRYCKEYGIRPLAHNVFSNSLLQQLHVIVDKNIYKKKVSNGTVIENISLSKNDISNKALSSISSPAKAEFVGFIDE